MIKAGNELKIYNKKIKLSLGLAGVVIVSGIASELVDDPQPNGPTLISGISTLGAIFSFVGAQKHIYRSGKYLILASSKLKN